MVESEYRDRQLDSVTIYDKERSNMNMTEFLLHSTDSSGVGNSPAIFNYDTVERVLNELCDIDLFVNARISKCACAK